MFWLGVALSLVGWLWLVVNAFRASALWGIGSLVISPIALVFGLLNLGENKIPLLLAVAGLVLYFIGAGAVAGQAMDLPQ